MECSDGTCENCDSNDSENPIKGEKHESRNCSDGSAVNCADESVILDMLVPMPADSVPVDNLNATDEKKRKDDVNGFKDCYNSSGEKGGKGSLQKQPEESGKKSPASRSMNHD